MGESYPISRGDYFNRGLLVKVIISSWIMKIYILLRSKTLIFNNTEIYHPML